MARSAGVPGRSSARPIAALVAALLFVAPLVFMLFGALRPPGQPPPDGFELLPRPLSWENYDIVFAFMPLWRYIFNSLTVALAAVPVSVFIASLAGFAIATAAPRAKRLLLAVTVGLMLFPLSAVWVPRFVLFKWLGLTDTLLSLAAPALMGTTPFHVLIFALAYHRIPRQIFEAARLDGWSPFSVWRRVAWPLAKPAAFAVGVLAFVAYWSNLVDPLLYLSSTDNYTVPMGLRALQTLEPQNFPILLAASVIATLPPVVAFLLAQRAFFAKTLEVA